jgi:hypothetical protein
MSKLNNQSISIQIMLISVIIVISIWIGTVMGTLKTQRHIKQLNHDIELLKQLKVKKTALLIGYVDGLQDGLDAYINTLAGRKPWNNALNNTDKSPLRIEQEKTALLYLQKKDLYDIPTSNYLMLLLESYYKE